MKKCAVLSFLCVLGASICALSVEDVYLEGNKISEAEQRRVSEVESLLKSGKKEAALSELAAISEKSDFMLRLEASVLISLSRNKEAAEIAEGLLEKDRQNIDNLELCAVLYAAMKNDSKKNEFINEVLKRDDANVVANLLKANDSVLKKNYKTALTHYAKALKREPKNEMAMVGMGRMLYYEDALKDAKEVFSSLLKDNPENASALFYMAKLYAEDGKYKEAEKNISRAIKLDSNNYEYELDAGQYAMNMGKFSEAARHFTRAIEIDGNYFLAYTYRASLYEMQGKMKEALSDWDTCFRVNPSYYFALEASGVIRFSMGDFNGASLAFQAAAKIGKNLSYDLMTIVSLLRAGKNEEAKNYAKPVMRNMDKKTEEYKLIRLLHDGEGQNSEAALLNAVAKVDTLSKGCKLYFYLGEYFLIKESFPASKECFQKALSFEAPMVFEYKLAELESKK